VSPPSVSLLGCARLWLVVISVYDCKPEAIGGSRASRLDGGVKSGTCSKP